MLIPNIKPAIKRAGNINQLMNTAIPARIMKTSAIKPITITKLFIIAPKILKIKLEKRASRYFGRSKPLPLETLYLRQGAKKVLRSKDKEK